MPRSQTATRHPITSIPKSLPSPNERQPNRSMLPSGATSVKPASKARAGISFEQKIEFVPIGSIKPRDRRARTHSDNQLAQLMGSFDAFGFINPLLIDETGRILAGHARWEAAKRLGYDTVPVLRFAHLTEDEKRAFVIADNRIAEKAGWDIEVLALELEELSGLDLSFELDVIGFNTAEIDVVLSEADARISKCDMDPADAPVAVETSTISRLGDLWLLGHHRVLCASALDATSYDRVLGGAKVRMALTDPPFNLKVAGFVSSQAHHREFAMASGEMSDHEFIGFLTEAVTRIHENLIEGGLSYVFMDHRHLLHLQLATQAVKFQHINLCVWDKGSGGQGSFYRSAHELCVLSRKGSTPHLNNVELGRHGRNRTNIWRHPGLSSFGRGRDEALADHPTVKPVALLVEAIKDCTKRGELVLDPFLGSGSMLIAAERAGRRGAGIELEPKYVDVTVRRWQKLTGGVAIHADTGQSFADVAQARSVSSPSDEAALESSAVLASNTERS